MKVNASRKNVEFDTETARKITEKIQQARRAGKRIAFVYDRVSSDQQGDGMSLDYQSDNAAGYARRAGLEVVHYFTVIESASKGGRKIFNYMLDLALGFGVKNVIFKSTDRMSRNYNDLVRIENLMDKSGFQIHFYQSGTILNDKASSSDRFMLGIELAVAKHWSDKISQDVRQANLYKVKNNLAPQANLPCGYIYDKKNRRHLKDPAWQKTIQYIFDEFDTGDYTLGEMAKHLIKKKIPTVKGGKWKDTSVRRILVNPFYTGYFKFKGEIYKGRHEPYISKKRYDARLKTLRERKIQAKRISAKYRYGKFVKCFCGVTMSCTRHRDTKYVFHRSSCRHDGLISHIPEHKVDTLLEEAARRIKTNFSPRAAEFLKAILLRTAEQQACGRGSELAHCDKQLAKLEKRTGKLLELFSDGELNQTALRRKMGELEKQSEHTRETRLALAYDHDALTKNINEIVDKVLTFPDRLLAATPDNRVVIVRELADHVVWDRKTLKVAWKKPYAVFMTPEFQALLGDIEDFASRMRPRFFPSACHFETHSRRKVKKRMRGAENMAGSQNSGGPELPVSNKGGRAADSLSQNSGGPEWPVSNKDGRAAVSLSQKSGGPVLPVSKKGGWAASVSQNSPGSGSSTKAAKIEASGPGSRKNGAAMAGVTSFDKSTADQAFFVVDRFCKKFASASLRRVCQILMWG